MYDFLLFVHVLAGFFLMITVVIFTAYALGWQTTPRGVTLAGWLWDVGGIGTLIFGVWLALERPQYDFFDGWIISALVLWIVIALTGMRARWAVVGTPGSETRSESAASLAMWHWMRAIGTVAILLLMFYKPGA